MWLAVDRVRFRNGVWTVDRSVLPYSPSVSLGCMPSLVSRDGCFLRTTVWQWAVGRIPALDEITQGAKLANSGVMGEGRRELSSKDPHEFRYEAYQDESGPVLSGGVGLQNGPNGRQDLSGAQSRVLRGDAR